MWRRLLTGPWPEPDNLLSPAVQAQATDEIYTYWQSRGWQVVLGEVVLWAAATYQGMRFAWLYGVLAGLITLAYLLGFNRRWTALWLMGTVGLFGVQGALIDGLGTVTALSFMVPYTFAGMLLYGRRRVLVQAWCVLAFWGSLIYEVLPALPQLHPVTSIQVSYDILLAAFIFQSLRFVNQLAVQLNTVQVEEEMRLQSQQFLARVSHELRTPLNSVLGFARLLERADLPDTQRGYLYQVVDEGEHLNRLVSDLLDSAHLATGKLTLQFADCDVNAVCRIVAEEHRPGLKTGVALLVDCDDTLPTIQADAVRLRQAVGNLVSNASKHTARGEIRLRTTSRDSRVIVEVADTGIGVPEDMREKIFVPFVQGDSRSVGVGLGLDIARQLVRLHGGDITLEDAPGGGSVFRVGLPTT